MQRFAPLGLFFLLNLGSALFMLILQWIINGFLNHENTSIHLQRGPLVGVGRMYVAGGAV